MAQSSLSPDPVVFTLEGIEDALQRAVSTAFEEMVFLEVSRSKTQELGTDQVFARLDVLRPLRCSFTLNMSVPLVDACIEVLYCGTPATDGVRQDITNELANTIAGLLMSNMNESCSIALGLPRGGKGLAEPESGNPITHAYHTEVGTFSVTVCA